MDGVFDLLKLKAEAAATKIAMAIEAHSMSMTPVDQANLINSLGRDVQPLANGVVGTVYYGAFYAPYVHAAKGKLKGKRRANGRGYYWDPSGEPRFLEKAGENAKKQDAPLIIAQEMSL